MALKPMTYTTIMPAAAHAVYQTIVNEQLKYFQYYDACITKLFPGVKVNNKVDTKIQKKDVDSTFEVVDMATDQRFTTQLNYAQGTIKTTFELEALADGTTKVRYSELNSFNNNRMTTNFWFVGWVYTFMYRHNLKKRMQYIASLAQPAA